jgi:phosphate-selective porin
MRYFRIALLAAILSIGSLNAGAVSDSSDDSDEEPAESVSTAQAVTGPTFQPGLLVQSVADFATESAAGTNGFSLAKARVNLTGTLNGGWNYMVQTDFAASPSLLDARIRYRPTAAIGVTTGMYKVPFSREWLTSAAKIDFVRRSQVVAALSPKRDVGVTVAASPGEALSLQTGVFNGNGRSLSGNDNNRFLYVARLETNLRGITESLTLGGNLGYNDGSNPTTDPSQLLAGGDLRLTPGRMLVSAEAIYGEQSGATGADIHSFGYHLTAGYTLSSEVFQQLLVRWDRYTPDADTDRSTTLLIAGYNVNPTDVIGMQINYIVPTGQQAFERHQLLIDLQLVW